MQGLADEQRRAELERQQIQSDLKSHVDGCVEGQKRVDRRFDDMDDRFDQLDAGVKRISDAQIASAAAATAVAQAAMASNRPKWWHQLLGAAVVGVFGWMGATIWNMENARITALQDRPGASVTVNPAAAPSPPPVAPPVASLPPGAAVQAPVSDAPE